MAQSDTGTGGERGAEGKGCDGGTRPAGNGKDHHTGRGDKRNADAREPSDGVRAEQYGSRLDFGEARRPRHQRAAHRQSDAGERQNAVVHIRTAVRGASRLPATVEHTQGDTRVAQPAQARLGELSSEDGPSEEPCHGTGDSHQTGAVRRGARHSLHACRLGKPRTGRNEVRHAFHRRGCPGIGGSLLDTHQACVACRFCRRPLSVTAYGEVHRCAEGRSRQDSHGANSGEQARGSESVEGAIPHERTDNALLKRLVLWRNGGECAANQVPRDTRLRHPHHVDRYK